MSLIITMLCQKEGETYINHVLVQPNEKVSSVDATSGKVSPSFGPIKTFGLDREIVK